MNKQQFLSRLAALTSALSRAERAKALDFYAEIIDDRIENGEDEQAVIAELGDISKLAEKILAENPHTKRSAAAKVWIAIGLILGSPIWLSLGLAAAAVLFALYITAWAILVSLFAVVLSLLIVGAAGFFCSFFFLFQSPLAGIFQIGAGLFCLGLGVISAVGVTILTKLFIRATVSLSKKLKNLWFKWTRKAGRIDA